MLPIPLLWVLFFLGWSGSAVAAPSFDCHRAKLPVELLICGDEALSRRDGEMGEAFLAAGKRLDAAGLEASRKEQQQWLAQRLQRCHISSKRGEMPADEPSAVTCLMAVYQERIHALTASSAHDTPGVEWANPQGVVKGVSQVTVRFTHPMVPLGDPRLEDPFVAQCPGQGKGRWADSRNWIYDFEHALPAGIRCRFTQKTLKTLDGHPLTQDDSFEFSTGGAAIITTIPSEGYDGINEDQVFLLGLDAPMDPASVEHHVHCQVSGVAEKIGVRLLSLEERKSLVQASEDFRDYYLGRLSGEGADPLTLDFGAEITGGTEQERFLKLLNSEKAPVAAVQCKRLLVPGSEVSLVWGQGVTSLSGVATATDQVLHFKVREPFIARFSCQRVNKEADCVPLLPLSLYFNAPVARSLAEKITVTGAGETRHPRWDDGEEWDDFVQWISFPQPFQEKQTYTLSLPADFKDDAGRDLANHDEFPLQVSVDEMPPLAKFSASFGVIEAGSDPVLPVTLRHLEPFVSEDPAIVGKGSGLGATAQVGGRMFKVEDPAAFPVWIKRIAEAQREKSHWDQQTEETVIERMVGEDSVFTAAEVPFLTTFQLPKPNGAQAFEVMGIPIPKPGFYVVELASHRLGLALHGKPKPYHVQTAALVTNMSAHFFKGRESSLVWVTALDRGTPVAGAKVTVADCARKIFAQGVTDRDGLFKMQQELPAAFQLPECPGGERAFQVTASLEDDVTFTLSSWNSGIERWSFNLPGPQEAKPQRIHTVLDRSLFRGGETVHMKHVHRKHGSQGFSFVGKNNWPKKVLIRHAGGTFETTFPLSWDDMGVAESRFEIPKEAKLGTYEISMDNVASGNFRVEAFRVPLMTGMVKPVKQDLIQATQADLDLQVRYLAGGMAGNAPVKVRGMISARTVTFPDYEDIAWANGDVPEGKIPLGRPQGDDGEDGAGGGDDHSLSVIATTLDAAGGGRVVLQGWGAVASPKTLLAEMEYRDPNGEILVSSARMNLWPTGVVVGIKLDGWMQDREAFRFRVVTVDTQGKVRGDVPVVVDLLERKTYSHRKRLLGGFYAYDQFQEVKKVQEFCSGKTDSQGNLLCEGVAPAAGNVIIRARVVDEAGHVGYAHADVWIPDARNTSFSARDGDRMDLVPEKRRYEPGETATFQVRMPFQEATALVLVAREGVMETLVQPLSGQSPQISVPILGHYGPNVFVGVLAVRGRNGAVQPTALIDMGRPAMRLGMTQIEVGWRDYALDVGVKADREAYKTRETAQITVMVRRANGESLPPGGEIALAAVDEGLLELRPNESWNLLEGMMAKRGLEVETSTAMGRVVGKRHFGKKAVPQGGGGGRSLARELFDTLLLWEGRVRLDDRGMASVKVPLNDSITSFRIVAVATAGADLFGTGSTSIRASRDVVLFSGVPPVVREGDHFQGGFTVRNAGEKPFQGRVTAVVKPEGGVGALPVQDVTLNPGEAKELFWDVTAAAVGQLSWDVEVRAEGISDRIKVTQEVLAAVPVRVMQSSLVQMEQTMTLDVAKPADALPDRGGVRVGLSPSLAGELAGVMDFMKSYPYGCMEQRISKAVVLDDTDQWKKIVASLPGYLDGDGLVKYFSQMTQGSDVLTSYLLAVADVADWEIPKASLEAMAKGLRGFVEGKLFRGSHLATADLAMRKVAALSALARYETLDPKLGGSIVVEPHLWPTSTVVDWIDLLNRVERWPGRDALKKAAMDILRARLHFSGSLMGFSTEKSDYFWWLMVSADVNANRAIVALWDEADWREDMGRMMRGSLLRRQGGRWSTTIADAWGVLAVKGFGTRFEGEKVTGETLGVLGADRKEWAWSSHPDGGHLEFSWPREPSRLQVTHRGLGNPWLTVESRAAVPLSEPLLAGYRVTRTVTALERKREGEWHRGDLYRVRLEVEGKGDMTWVVVED
ncbi:MAG: MG2 domain-containing protein, partial [Magnetococcus sp. THC-1_WYH]